MFVGGSTLVNDRLFKASLHKLGVAFATGWSGCEHHDDATRIPLPEATQRLLNRCSDLLFAKERLAQDKFCAAEADFVGRNLAKAKLALDDVVLAMAGRFALNAAAGFRNLPESIHRFFLVTLLESSLNSIRNAPTRRLTHCA